MGAVLATTIFEAPDAMLAPEPGAPWMVGGGVTEAQDATLEPLCPPPRVATPFASTQGRAMTPPPPRMLSPAAQEAALYRARSINPQLAKRS